MTRRDAERLEDIRRAVQEITEHLQHGDLDTSIVFDAVRMRIFEIGEVVKAIDSDLLAREPEVPWREIARMRDHIAHRYWVTRERIVRDVVDHDLHPLLTAVDRLQAHLDVENKGQAQRPSPRR